MEEALARARSGDPDGFADLYRALAPALFAYLRAHTRTREDAEDLLGETFVALVRDLPRRGDAGGLKAWLYRVATNRAIDRARARDRRPEAPLEELGDAPDDHDVEAAAEAAIDRARVWAAVDALPDEQRRVVTLRLAGGLTAREIGRVLGKTPGAVKALQHRAIANIAGALGDRGAPEAYPEGPPGRLEG